MAVVERLVILRYDRTSSFTSVSKARQKLFSKRSRQPPLTRAALVNHAKRAVFQWPPTLLKEPILPCPSQWGW